MSKGILIVLSGFSGTGKGTVIKRLLEKYEGYTVSVSATTRKPREGEKDGEAYFFKTKEQFEEMIKQGELIEYASYQGNYYGTPKAYVRDRLDKGINVILEIEMVGAMKVKCGFPDTPLIFLAPPSAEILKSRLTGRGTESAEQIKGRLLQAVDETAFMTGYDYLLVNDDLEKCVDDLDVICRAERMKMRSCGEHASALADDIRNMRL